MLAYITPLIFLSVLAVLENSNRLSNIISNKIFYFSLALFFIIFIGLRYEIGCDWFRYLKMLDKFSYLSFNEILKFNFFNTSSETIQELGHVVITIFSRNIYVLNTIYASIFIAPLFFFCSRLNRVYLALLVSYPYFIIVVGMGPIRQAACISILMLSFLYVQNKRYISHFVATILSVLIHQFSIIFNALLLIPILPRLNKNKLSKNNILFAILLISIIAYSLPSYVVKFYFYITLPNEIMAPAKGAFYVWIINFIPALIFLLNRTKFKLQDNLKKVIIIFSIFEILLLPLVFLKSVIAYRLILYIFPSSILITTKIPDIKLFKIESHYVVKSIILLSFLNLIIWTNYAHHAYCWLPYKNIIIN